MSIQSTAQAYISPTLVGIKKNSEKMSFNCENAFS